MHRIMIEVVRSRVYPYQPTEGGERGCNSRTSCIEGEMLAVKSNIPYKARITSYNI